MQASTSCRRSSWAVVLRTMRYVVITTHDVLRCTRTNVLQSAVEQAKDEQISDYIRSSYKSATGSDVPIKDKETRFG
jgi:hypothetical protein